ncbi:hypothetical protein [Magnetospirillum sp. ME-1]|uniref:hypothetical protein n=1 Tax=Magnetospirillum sp. ME-1 TaxID=1639348 RepID=UPI00143DDFE1|nr:hypothetical protein [Magnetospirillum sp. ME-1]
MEFVVADTGLGMDQDGGAKALSLFGQLDLWVGSHSRRPWSRSVTDQEFGRTA